MRLLKISVLFFVLFSLAFSPVYAQDDNPPVYIVQPGDTLTSIAFRFVISVDDLIKANNITDANALQPGDQLILPGLVGVHGTLTTRPVALGETLRDISRTFQVSSTGISRLNHLTSPSELYAGVNLILPVVDESKRLTGRASLAEGESLLEFAVAQNTDPWSLQSYNAFSSPWDALPGDTLYFPSSAPAVDSAIINPSIQSVLITPLPLVQGKTTEIKVNTRVPLDLSGSLLGQDLHFESLEENTYVALAGVNGLQNPGIYPIRLTGKGTDGISFDFEQMILVESGNYYRDPNLTVDPSTVDPKVTVPEQEQITQIAAQFNPKKYWDGLFSSPGYDPNWITSWYGNRRTYNEDPTETFHTGVDYGGGVGIPIKADAAGVVVFAGPLTVRGNATIIDHGWGIYSGFWHQSEIKVQVGDFVTPGQVIGLIGGTGRVTGAHLHWEIWVNGIQVDPLDWLKTVYP